MHCVTTRKVAVVSPREAYTLVYREILMNPPPRGHRTKGKVTRALIISCVSKELGEELTPVTPGSVRPIIYCTGYYMEEVEIDDPENPGKKKLVTDIHFFSEIDPKIS